MCDERWTAKITYIVDAKGTTKTRTVNFEEIIHLHDIVERGPNFYAIKDIKISLKDGPNTNVIDSLFE